MPYVKVERRAALAEGEPTKGPGDLTYLITMLLKRYWINGPRNYASIAEILGSLDGARLDFARKIVTPYEIEKEEANGDVW